MVTTGTLVLVGVPIGNLGDLSPRAAAELAGADAICCEDSRRTGKLLELTGIARRGPLLQVNDHTEAARTGEVLERLRRGERVVVVSDAGMPGVSDPGERLVRAVAADGLTVVVVPGPSAALAALVTSGLPAGRFCFEGFLPRKGSGRAERLRELTGERRTMVFFEAPHRLARTLADLTAALGPDRPAALARELTKRHEEVRHGALGALAIDVAADPPPGECALVVAGAEAPGPADDDSVVAALRAARERGLSSRDASTEVAAALGVAKRRAYALAIALDT
ncbi:MAG: 16S rRNA (cytidine(1402)-2'-O)-methyltransferase [Acidimicrobiales bacterium]